MSQIIAQFKETNARSTNCCIQREQDQGTQLRTKDIAQYFGDGKEMIKYKSLSIFNPY